MAGDPIDAGGQTPLARVPTGGLPGTISGPRSVSPEPDPNSKTTAIVRLPTSPAVRYRNMARQRYYRP